MAVADYIKEHYPDAEILFVGARGKMEMTRVPQAGYRIIGLNIAGLQRRLTLENLLFPLKVISSFLASLHIIKEFKPDVVAGFGGYASSPVTLAAARKKVPVILQEQNSFAGLANKAIAKRAAVICVAYEGMEKFFPAEKIVLTGNPVRSEIVDEQADRQQAAEYFSIDSQAPTLLILGGSLGARTINEAVLAALPTWQEAGINVLWQTGKLYFEEMKQRAADHIWPGLKIMEFVMQMGKAYAAADLVVSRAGALTVSELCVAGKATIFIPSPNVAEDHQTHNARALVDKDAAGMLADSEAVEQLAGQALQALNDSDRLAHWQHNIKVLARPNATRDIAEQIIGLIE